LDEPAAGLDQKVEQDFFALLAELNRQMTIVLVSHDLGFVSQWVRTVVCVHRTVQVHPTSAVTGRVIADMYGGEMRLVHHDHAGEHHHG
jgi:zinc transport system ATP-binding protein